MKSKDSLSQPGNKSGLQSSRRRFLWGLWAFLIATILVWLLLRRNKAIDGDFADTNQLMYAGVALIWLVTVVFGFLTNGLRSGLKLIIIPVLAGFAFLVAFRLDRLDGELRPQFSWRWSAQPELPTVSQELDGQQPDSDTRFLPKDSDSQQFLGPRRNATWPEFEIETDWKANPPTILWKQPIGEGWSSFAVQGDIAITMEQRDDEEWVSAYVISNGTLLWSFVMPGRYESPIAGNGPRSTPLIHGDRVFACSAVSTIACLDFSTGRLLWSHSLNDLVGTDQAAMQNDVNWGRSGSPLVVGNSLVIPLGGTSDRKESLIAFDCSTGDELWRSGGEQISYSSPAMITLNGMSHIAYVSANSLSGFDPNSGNLLWRVEYEGLLPGPNVAQPIQVDEQHLFFSKGYGIGARLIRITRDMPEGKDEAGGEWSAQVVAQSQSNMRTKFTNPVIAGDAVYGLSDGILECINLESLDRRWKRGRYHHGQVLLLGNNLLVFAEDGRLVLVAADPTEHRELAVFPVLGNVCWNLPALAGNRLLVRNATEAACIELPIR